MNHNRPPCVVGDLNDAACITAALYMVGNQNGGSQCAPKWVIKMRYYSLAGKSTDLVGNSRQKLFDNHIQPEETLLLLLMLFPH